MPTNFDRKKPIYRKSLALHLFKRHHTHFNDIFWAHKLASAHTYSSTRPFKTTDHSSVLFNVAGKPRTPTLGDWAESYHQFDQWTQMASIMAICGYLETYIAQISTSAIESSPALVLGGGGVDIDGAAFLKHNPKYDLYSYVEPLVRGDWQSRISAYTRLFGPCPFEKHLSVLEKLRNLRNDTGHSFGRDIKSMKFSASSLVQKLPNISDKEIQGYLGTVESVANSIDAHLFPSYVGAYEIIKVYHDWLPTQTVLLGRTKLIAKAFSVYFNKMTLNPHGNQKTLGLMNYYSAL